MRHTTVYLDESRRDRLAREARRRGVTRAALIREAIDRLLQDDEREAPQLPLGSSDRLVARNVDAALTDGFGRQ